MTRRIKQTIQLTSVLVVLLLLTGFVAMRYTNKESVVSVRYVTPDIQSPGTRNTFYFTNASDRKIAITSAATEIADPGKDWEHGQVHHFRTRLLLGPYSGGNMSIPNLSSEWGSWRVRFKLQNEATGLRDYWVRTKFWWRHNRTKPPPGVPTAHPLDPFSRNSRFFDPAPTFVLWDSSSDDAIDAFAVPERSEGIGL